MQGLLLELWHLPDVLLRMRRLQDVLFRLGLQLLRLLPVWRVSAFRLRAVRN